MKSKLTYEIVNIEDYKALVSKAKKLAAELKTIGEAINNFKFETKIKSQSKD